MCLLQSYERFSVANEKQTHHTFSVNLGGILIYLELSGVRKYFIMICNHAHMTEEKDKGKYTTVSIPMTLAEKLKKKIEGTGFTSLSSYVTYVLRELVANMGEDDEAFSKEDEERIKERLRALGYLD